ncbi:MAG TPA: hypothetical protein VK674_06415 [Candidatus Limnocylindria bacterium]|nr:hypothetical protein [Candidatus Limnocylindria bacterium]
MAELLKWATRQSGKSVTQSFSSLKRASRQKRFAEISRGNLAVADELVKESQRLIKAGREKDAKKILDIANKLLDNNRTYLDTVGEVLSDAD